MEGTMQDTKENRPDIEGKKRAYQQQMEAQFKEWSAKVDVLKAKAERAEARVKVGYYDVIEQVRTKQQQLRQRLDMLRNAGTGAWEDLKGGVEKAWTELKTAFDRATGRMK
jgi:hypothetical protein